MGVIGGVAGGVIHGVMEAARDATAGSVEGTVTDDRTYRRGVRMQDEIFSHKGGSGGLPDSSKTKIYCSDEEVYIVGFTPH